MRQIWTVGSMLVPRTWHPVRGWFVWLAMLGALSAFALLASPGLRGWALGRDYGAARGVAVLMLSGATGALAVGGVVWIITRGQRRMPPIWLVAVLPFGYLIGVWTWALYPATRLPVFECALFLSAAPLLTAAGLVMELHLGLLLLCFLQILLLRVLLLRPRHNVGTTML